MRKYLALLLLAGLVLAVAACDELDEYLEKYYEQQLLIEEQPQTPVDYRLSLEQQLEQARQLRRAATHKPLPDPGLLADWQGAQRHSLRFTEARQAFSPEAVYSLEAVTADLELLFQWYESAYGPYYYFGGAAAFEAAQQQALAELAALPQISGQELQDALLRALAFVGDAHLRINGRATQPVIYGYLGVNIGFRATAEGFVDAATGQVVQSIAGAEDFAQQLVFSADATGALVYRYLLLAESEPPPLTVVYADGSRAELRLENAHSLATQAFTRPEAHVTLEYRQGLPLLTVTAMGFDQGTQELGARQFLAYAEQLREEPVLILDLRGNPGGNGLLPQKWLELYTGEIVPTNYYQLRRYDVYAALGMEEDQGQNTATYVPQEEFDYYSRPQRLNASWGLQDALPDRLVSLGDRLLVVLVSKETASAADIFTDLCYNIDNTLVIGSNTAGQLLSNAFVSIELPETGLLAQLGNTLDVFDPVHFQENRGFLPDLWVTDDALAVALALYGE